MDAGRWQRIEALFDQAMELAEPDRRGFLDEACADDPDVRDEVAAMVAGAPDARAVLQDAVGGEIQLIASRGVTERIGQRIGPFRLISLLGEGGMGAVYLAERADAQFAQRVAIKILPHAVGSPESVARFRDERQILAALEHPNIVRLLDGGNTETGLPYLVMEHIEGTTITRYATEHALSVRARVALVRQVCAALQYAHQNLVVHRDIKPGNILVNAEQAPKILDFGIAKLLAPMASFAREARTRTGLAMFTPEYASPEQARGDAISTATDVYSAGAVLYELVTGEPAHQISGNALEALRVICEVEPVRPSAAAPRDRHRELAGDLDNIILKALHKEPGRRYASMEQLANDLGCWLAGLPVAARTATVGYRARKFVRRNKTAVVAASLVTASLIGATVISLRQAHRADEQAARAEVETANAVDAAQRAQIETARAQTEAERARKAELRVQAQLDQIKAEQAARATAEADARVKGSEAKLSRAQLQVALDKTRQEKQHAEQQSTAAREAEARAQEAAKAEKATREASQALYQRERERVKQLEDAGKKITTQLR